MTDTSIDPSPKRNPLEQLLADFRDRLAAVQKWASEHESEITAFVQGVISWNRIQLHLKTMGERFEDTEWEYLLDRVDFAAGIALLAALDRDGAEGVADLLEAALGRPSALAPMLASLQTVELPNPQRRQLAEGLRHIARRDYELAVPLLITPFEGIVHLHARDLGLIEPHKGKKDRFTEQAGRTGIIGGIEDLLEIEGVGFDDAFADFLVLHVYGGTGDAYRHGIATGGFRQRALMLTVALLGWLSAIAPPDLGVEPLRTLLFEVGNAEWARLLAVTTPTPRPLAHTAEATP